MEKAFSTLSPTQHRFLQLLLKENVRFLVIGGYAVRFHGCLRPTEDWDILVLPTTENAACIRRCLSRVGAYHVDVAEQYLRAENKKIDWKDVDILTTIYGGTYMELGTKACIAQSSDGQFTVISKADLIREKQLSLKDPAQSARHDKIRRDLKCLRRLNKQKENGQP